MKKNNYQIYPRNRGNGQARFQPVNRRSVSGKTEAEVRRQSKPLRIPRNIAITDSVIVDLTYPDVVFNRNNVGGAILSWRYRMNSVFDPDPGVSSGAVPGHIEWSSFFNIYRVLHLAYTIDFSNLEASPLDIVVAPSISDLGLNYSGTVELFGNPYANQGMISSKGGMDRLRLQGALDLGQFYGLVSQYLGNDAFAGGVGGNPSAINYINIGATNAALFTANNGVDVRVTLKFTTLYHSRKIYTG